MTRRSAFALAGVVAVLVAISWPARIAPAPTPTGRPTHVLPAAARGLISRVVGQDQRKYFAHPTGRALAITNGGGGLRARFTRQGAFVGVGEVVWPLGLSALGRGARLGGVSAASPMAQANQVRYVRRGVTEWYANGPLGIEQGFTVTVRPGGAPRAALTLALGRLPATLTASLSGDGRSARLMRGGRTVLRYTGLLARDAEGRSLPAWIEIYGGRLQLRVDDAAARYPLRLDPFIQVAKLTASDGATGDVLGSSVAISGDTIVVGAPQAKVAGNAYQGAAYVFVKPTGGWGNGTPTQAKLTASDGGANHEFGSAVAISGDTVVVGAPDNCCGTGSAYVFAKPAGGWGSGAQPQNEAAKLTAADGATADNFGAAVAIDGGTVVVGADEHNSQAGTAYVFTEPAGGWGSATPPQTELVAANAGSTALFGASVAISGATVAIGAPDSVVNGLSRGAVYAFVEPAGGWGSATPTQAKLTASDGHANDALGDSVATSGDTIAAGAPDWPAVSLQEGGVYVFVKPASGWTDGQETARLTASSPSSYEEVGKSVAISGGTVAAGAPEISASPGSGKTYVFAKPSGGWGSATPTQDVLTAADGAGGDELGISVAADGGAVVAGASHASPSGNTAQGAAYVFAGSRSTTTTVSCAPGSVTVSQASTCTANVSDNTTGGTDPSGSVTFSTDSSGSFGSGGTCALAGGGNGSASCQLTYTPSAVGSGTHTITAAYGGDTSHDSSSGQTPLTVAGSGSGSGGGGGSSGGGGGGGGGSSVIARLAVLGRSAVMPGSLAVSAQGSSAGSGATITDYAYSIATGSSSNSFNCGGSPNMSFAANAAGTYRVAVTATNSLGATSTASAVLTVPAGVVTHIRGATAAAVSSPGAWAVSCATAVVPSSPGCVTSFQFGIVDAVSESTACFSISERPLTPTPAAHDALAGPATIPASDQFQYTATIYGPVGLNGLYLPLPARARSTLRSASLTDAGAISFGSVSVGAGGYSLLRVNLTQTLTAYTYTDSQEIGDFSVGSGGSQFEGLPFSGGMSLTLAYQKAIVGAQVSLPSLLSVVGGPATLSGTLTVSNGAPNLYALHANFSELDFGFMTITEASVDYDQSLGELKIGGNIQIEDAGVKMTPIPPNGIIFEHGQFKSGGLDFDFPAPEPEIFPGINLKSIGGSLAVNPIVIEGRIGLDVLHLATVNGALLAAFPSPTAPFTLTSAWLPPIRHTPADGHVFTSSPLLGVGADVEVSVPVIGTLNLFSGYLIYNAPYSLWLGGHVDFDVLDGLLQWGGGMDGQFNEQTGAFNVEGYVYGSIKDWAGINIHAAVSSQGAGGCGDFAGVLVGGGVQWNGGSPKIFLYPPGSFTDCTIDRFTEDHVFTAAVAAALRPLRIHIRRGAPTQDIRLEGSGGSPTVSVTGPGGLALASPSGAGVVHSGSRIAIGRLPSLNATEIALGNPRPGNYTITPLSGSAPITSVATALAPPRPQVKARVLGAGPRRALVYDIRRRAEQTVTLFEVSSAGMWRQIGTVRGGGRGRLRFAPTPDRGSHRIVAQFTLHGVPVPGEDMTVARFRPPPITPPAPRRLRVARTGAALTVTWGPVSGAVRYAMAIRQPARGVVAIVTPPGRRSVRIPGLDPLAGGTVTVVAESGPYGRGVAARAAFKPVPKKQPAHKRKRKHR